MEGTWLRVKRAVALLLCVIVMSLGLGSNTFADDTTEENLILLDDKNVSGKKTYSSDNNWYGVSYTVGSWVSSPNSVGLIVNDVNGITDTKFAIVWNNYYNTFTNGYAGNGKNAYKVESSIQDNFEDALKYSYYIYKTEGVQVKHNNTKAKISNPNDAAVPVNQDDPTSSGIVNGLTNLCDNISGVEFKGEGLINAVSIAAVYLNFLPNLNTMSQSDLISSYDMGREITLTQMKKENNYGGQFDGYAFTSNNKWQLYMKKDSAQTSGVLLYLRATLDNGVQTQAFELPGLYELLRGYCTSSYRTGNDLPVEKYSNIRQLYSFIESIVNPSKEEQNGNEYDSARDTIKEWIAKADETGAPIDYYWVNALYYVLTGKTYLVSDSVFRQYDIAEIDNSSELSAEEKLRIKTYIKVALSNTDFESRESGVQAIPIATGNEQLFSAAPNVDTIRFKIQSVLSTDYAMYTDAESAYVSERTALSMIDNAYGLAVYLSGEMYGFNYVSSESQDAQEIQDCLYLKFLEPNLDSPVSDGIVSVTTKIPTMLKMQKVAGTESAYEAYAKLVYLYMLMEYKAKTSFGMTTSDTSLAEYASQSSSNFYVNPDLEAWLAQVKNLNEEEIDVSDMVGLFKVYDNMYKAMDYLGIQPDEDSALYRVKEYYGFIVGYVQSNAYISESTLVTNNEAMGGIFSISGRDFTQDYKTGVALSATYVPLQTNLYDIHSVDTLRDSTWVSRFHYGYGFYRKALYMDTNINAAVDRYVKGSAAGTLKIATLRDLLSCDRDIVLYLDTNFYNVDELAQLQGYSYNKVNNIDKAVESTDEDASVWDNLTELYREFNDMDIESIVKTGDSKEYSTAVKKKVSGTYNNSSKKQNSKYVLSTEGIDEYLNVDSTSGETYHDEYSVLQSFAVVSAVYRQSSLYNVVSKQTKKNEPVFVSSPTLAAVEGVTQEQWNTLYNYMMLANLESALGIDYATTLDLDSVLYMDIYGNIVTEGGLVVIPAASNATLSKPSEYTVYTAGFLSLYSYGNYEIPADYNNAGVYTAKSNSFLLYEDKGVYKLQDALIKVDNEPVSLRIASLEINDIVVKKALQSWMEYKLKDKGYMKFTSRVWLITEVLRGAPMDSIDKEFEGLSYPVLNNTVGIYLASKLDEIVKQLLPTSNGNSFIALPNLAYMDNVEYVIFYIFKVVFAGLIVLLVIRIYKDATQGKLGVKAVVQFILSCVLFLIAAFSIPSVLDISYYQVNKALLKDEASYLMLLNLEKQSEGREIGLTSVDSPESSTDLYLKVDDLDVPWYQLLSKLLASNAYNSVSEVYEDALSNNIYHGLPGVTEKGNSLYVSLDYIFNTSSIEFDSSTGQLTTRVLSTPYISFLTPYYVELDYLVKQINLYNSNNDIDTPELCVRSGGAVKTLGLITPYLTSQEFMELSQDPSGLKYVYKRPTLLAVEVPFTSNDLYEMEGSLWYADNLSSNQLDERLEKITDYTRDFVVKYRDALGKVSDDVFLKVMAMSIALKHNDVMNISSARALELYSIDAMDLIRLSISNRGNTLKGASLSFARYVYTYGGGLSVLMTVLLVLVYFLSSIVKPLCIFCVIGVVLLSLVIRKFRREEDNYAVEGFIISLGVLCAINLLYALMLKCSMLLANTKISMTLNLFIQIVIQIVYMIVLVAFTGLIVSNWKDFGRTKYEQMFYTATGNFKYANMRGQDVVLDSQNVTFNDRYTKTYGRNHRRSRDIRNNEVDVWARLRENDERRESNRGRR